MATRKWWRPWGRGNAAPAEVVDRTPPPLTSGIAPAGGVRAYKAARPGRLANGFAFAGGLGTSTREETRRDLRGLIAHARFAAQNIDYIKSYEMMVRRHVVGRSGISLQMDVRDPGGEPDRIANDLIEDAWDRWTRRGVATPCGRLSWWNVENIAATMLAREGNFLLRVHRGARFGPFAFQVAPVPLDLLDLDHCAELAGGAYVDGGIEFDALGRVLAYHLFTSHPGDGRLRRGHKRVRVPARDVIHVMRPNESAQALGVPQAHTALRRFNMVGKYEEAALAAAHFGAAAMVFFKQESDDAPAGEDHAEVPDEIAAGTTATLPPGMDIAQYTPNYPDGEMPGFVKAMLRGGAAGLGVSYAGLSSDMEGANFSSLRDGRGEERDEWRMMQRDLVEALHAEVFRAWLPAALVSREVPLPETKLAKFDAATWRPRSWASVNPKEDEAANDLAIRNRLRAPSDIVADRGDDFEAIARRFAADLDLMRELGIPIPESIEPRAKAPGAPAPAEAEAEPQA
jgi:lambda family phage portal protein